MARSPHSSWLVPVAIAAALAVPLTFTSARLLRASASPDRFDVLQVPSSRPFRLLSAPTQLTIANYYWLVTVQYIGEQALRRGTLDKLYALADLVTDLDPQHGYAYQTAGIGLSAVERVEESDAILKKGMERGPPWWSFPYYLAFNDYFYRGDYESAARWAERAARTPGASPNISKLALALRVESGSPERGVEFVEEMMKVAADERTAAALEEQHRLALLARDFARLDAAVERFRSAQGRDPSGLPELVTSGVVPEIPRDPYGGAYVWRDGAVHSTTKDFRFMKPQPGRRRAASPLRDQPIPLSDRPR